MKHRTHAIKLYIYNPENLSEVIDILTFNVKYIPAKKWNEYLILINDKFCGESFSVTNISFGNPISIREKIAKSIISFKNDVYYPFQNKVEVAYPNKNCIYMEEIAFNNTILKVTCFKSRDEISKYGLIF